MQIQNIKKRSGIVTEFEPLKISRAIEKSFLAVTGSSEKEIIIAITENVVKEMEKIFHSSVPTVENVQDLVEKEIMKQGYFDVAKAYILYRHEHNIIREKREKLMREKIENNDFTVIKNSGKHEKFFIEKINKTLRFAALGFENQVDIKSLSEKFKKELYDPIESREIAKALVLSARSFIERNPLYSTMTARLLRNIIYKETIGHDTIDYQNFNNQYRESFVKKIKILVDTKRLDSKMLSFDLIRLADALDPERDDLLQYLGLQTLFDRYFIKDKDTGFCMESPQSFWMRIAMGLSLNEKEKEDKAIQFYDVISKLEFIPSTPTLFHSGTTHPQLSSCYITAVDDSLDHIFKCIGDNAQLSKWSGGVANDWTSIRATGAQIQGTGVESQGVIPFLKIANDTTVAINRSGRRRGATCVYLEAWHFDIEDFLELKKNTGDERRRTHDMNTAVWIPDLFMKRVSNDGSWTLLSPDEAPQLHNVYGKKFDEKYLYYENLADTEKLKIFKKIKAKDLWKRMLTMLFETGHPWITFKDPCNIRSPQDHAGVVHSSNLCTEITLNTSREETAVCNLGSINLTKHISGSMLDVEKIKKTVTLAMHMLDNAIDINFYPTKEAQYSNLKHRPVGLGIMGFQDALYMQDIRFDSEKAMEFADYSMETISYFAILASANLAQKRGAYESYQGSKWSQGIFPYDTLALLEQERGQIIPIEKTSRLDWSPAREAIKKYGMRNSNCLAIAPTATISNIAGSFPSIEPIYKNIYVKSNMSGEFTITNQYLIEDLKKLNLWNENMLDAIKRNDGNISNISEIPQNIKDMYKETFDIDPEWLVRIAAQRGKWIDQSQSLNIFYKGVSGKKISDIYMMAWNLGLKTTYYLRTLAASGIEKSSIGLKQENSQTPSILSAPIPETTAMPHMEKITITQIKESATIRLCKIDDPTCESCQ